ncbi:MAG: helix-turn-helix transcriptional regulator [Bifidobacteriaceae bacterium]|jgi:DNA-binding CsgD family transcriptional regulator|nr:helix-turn-helix transcriptional regulator [Bifidobacteriaceae bacterium]
MHAVRRAAVAWAAGARASLPLAGWLVIGWLFGGFVIFLTRFGVSVLRDPAVSKAAGVPVTGLAWAVLVVLPLLSKLVREVAVAVATLMVGLPAVTVRRGAKAALLGAVWHLQHLALGLVMASLAFFAFPAGLDGILVVGGLPNANPVLNVEPALGGALFGALLVLLGIAPWSLRLVDRWLRWTFPKLIRTAPGQAAPHLFTFQSQAEAVAAVSALTARERETLALLAEGRTNAQIAAALFVAPETAKSHVSRVLAKLGVSNRVQATAVALRAGLRSPGPHSPGPGSPGPHSPS